MSTHSATAAPPRRTARIGVVRAKALITPLIPPLENGDRLGAKEFLHRYQAMPELKKAELIDGRVHIMASPVSVKKHARPDYVMHSWLAHYELETPGTEGLANPTCKMGGDRLPQPDALLRLLPEYGGATSIDDDDFLTGPPELLIEISSSSASIDLNDKMQLYRHAGVAEYLIWSTGDKLVDWFQLENGIYSRIVPDSRGVIRSEVFPGLWLNTGALLDGANKRMIETLNRGLRSAEHKKFVRQMSASKK